MFMINIARLLEKSRQDLHWRAIGKELGAPWMHDRMKDISHWALMRMTEISDVRSGLRSDIQIISENPSLSNIGDIVELKEGMRLVLLGEPVPESKSPIARYDRRIRVTAA